MKTNYESMKFKKTTDQWGECVWTCTDKEHLMLRGEIRKYGDPKVKTRWLFKPGTGMLFDFQQQRDIADFLQQLNKEGKP